MTDQLKPIPLVNPGFKGLNKAQSSVPDLDPGWAIECQNFVLDATGRLASRQGWSQLTASPLAGTPAIASMGELALANGSVFVVSAANNKLYSGTGTLTDITGSLTITGNNWQWVTFNGAIYGIQSGHPLITWNGTGNFVVAPLAASKSFTASITNGVMSVTAVASGVLGQSDVVTGTSVTAGTQIVAQLSGVTGGIGTYQLNQPTLTVVSEAMTVAPGTVPSGGSCGLAAFGRLWILLSDNQTIQYCALLDATTWAGVGTGSLNVATVWTRGIDQVVGIAAAGSKLVIFGTKQILIYADSAGAVIGLNPSNLYVYDTIEGTGLAARDSVQATGEGDLTFLSPSGVQNLQRLVTSGRDQPVSALDAQIRDYFAGYFANEAPAAVRSAYSPVNRFYLILLPISQRVFCYDTRFPMQDGTLRVIEWPSVTMTALLNQKSGTLLLGQAGVVGQYGTYLDNAATYSVLYNSPNLALKSADANANYENRLKIMKRARAVLYSGGTINVQFTWGIDFGGLTNSYQKILVGAVAEYGTAEYGTNGKYNVNLPAPSSGVAYAEYGGSAGLTIIDFPLSNTGRWLQFGFSATVNGAQVALQQFDAFVKIGRMT